MNERMLELRQRRGELLAQIEVQRSQLADIGARWETPLALADRGVSVLHFLRRHAVLSAAVVALVVARGQGVAGLLKRGWLIWRSLRHFAGLW